MRRAMNVGQITDPAEAGPGRRRALAALIAAREEER
jgi:hypothetical protein